MIYLISWRGWGWIALLLMLFVPAAFLGVASLMTPDQDAALLAFAAGWVVVGIVCFILGRRWNRGTGIHRFCTLKLETWGIIYACIGLLIGLPFVMAANSRAQFRKPLKPAAPANKQASNASPRSVARVCRDLEESC